MKRSGFSLIEIIVVVGIIGLLATAASLTFSKQRLRSRDTRRIEDVSVIGNALTLYVTDKGSPPDFSETIVSVNQLTVLINDGYLKDIPSDPLPAGAGAEITCSGYDYIDHFSWRPNNKFGNGTVGKRIVAVGFGSEVQPNNTGTHPYNSQILLRAPADGDMICNGSRWVGQFLGDRY